eukprot:TRINITY_DN5704_c0_g2_i6.p1 TRINITY_DN5704_c0_g2~~TRINITY_DN5704_c0_g2_i6.p1  ORF type:complete len:206 (+),score=42.38 TRINITY_DN5704_c0_g2_i6:271-888(+)
MQYVQHFSDSIPSGILDIRFLLPKEHLPVRSLYGQSQQSGFAFSQPSGQWPPDFHRSYFFISSLHPCQSPNDSSSSLSSSESEETQEMESTITLVMLSLPEVNGGALHLQTISHFKHPQFRANVDGGHLATNGTMMFAPTEDGKIFVWNNSTQELVAVFVAEPDTAIYDISLHPTMPILVASSTAGKVLVFKQDSPRRQPLLPKS